MAAVLKIRVKPGGDLANAEGGTLGQARQNIFKTLVIVTVCFTICWLPNQALYFYFNMGNYLNFSAWYYHGSVILVYCNSCCNPIIYVAQYDQFRLGIKTLKGKVLVKLGRSNVSSIGSVAQTGSITGTVSDTIAT